jgi:hypothetical protein
VKIIILSLGLDKGTYRQDLELQEQLLSKAFHPEIEVYWAVGGARSSYINNNRINLPIEDTLQNILAKTVLAINILDDKLSPDFIIRTNTSSYFNFKKTVRLCHKLKKNEYDFAGYWESYKVGYSHQKNSLRFVNGSGIYLSKKGIKVLKNLNPRKYKGVPDDVAITQELLSNNLKSTKVKRNNICYHHVFIPRAHIRLKGWGSHVLMHERMRLIDQFFSNTNPLTKSLLFVKIHLHEMSSVTFSFKKVYMFFKNVLFRKFKA